MGGTSLRSHIQTADNELQTAMNELNMSGGRRRYKRRGASKARRARRAGSSCTMKKGGMKMSKSRAVKGGMGAGFGAVLKEALVPFGLFAWQKRTQRRRSNKSKNTRRRR